MKHCWTYASPGAALALLLAAATPPVARAQCQLCAPADARSTAEPARPLTIDVETGIDFSRVAIMSAAGGMVEVDATSGQRRVSGGLVDLGGLGLSGTVRLTGEPGRSVRISLPNRVRLVTPEGGTAELSEIVTDLPPTPRLGPDGRLRFAFGGRLSVDGRATGNFRGRIAIVADYE
ncbi:DUF4402 domain-containing protein [Sphingomonas cavernae]|uniref:DUF4402 domain-containing protein n=1 Tax=Sphingomonas cavernae TaxID=2320861 RepID=A0A418WR61_9SPHN|nr:DUF4402 domain-containing protein [Sphingomonas cavernae]RJF93744.1 DUF4402 domain-containing protein [Sphingomonas cavernae]